MYLAQLRLSKGSFTTWYTASKGPSGKMWSCTYILCMAMQRVVKQVHKEGMAVHNSFSVWQSI